MASKICKRMPFQSAIQTARVRPMVVLLVDSGLSSSTETLASKPQPKGPTQQMLSEQFQADMPRATGIYMNLTFK